MAKTKESKHDEYVEKAKEFVHYVNTDIKTIGVFATTEDMLKANKNFYVKKLIGLYHYNIQMVIK